MKSVLVFFVALCAIAYAYPKPGERFDKEDESSEGEGELYIVPLERSQPRRPVFGFSLDDDLVPPPLEQHPFFKSNPWSNGADGGEHVDDFMSQMQQMLRELRNQLTELLHKSNAGGLPDTSSVGTRIGDDEAAPKNKSTSTTKVIDGHVVTVNETTYSSGDDNIGAVFRIKVVEVKPSETPKGEEEETDEESTNSGTEHETITRKSELEEDKNEETNEIPNHSEKVGSEVDDLNA